MNWFKDIIDYISRLFTWWVIINPWEAGIRIRLGRKVTPLAPGIWIKLPFIHSIKVQSVRLRVMSGELQTLTSKDGVTITIRSAVGFSIDDIQKLYDSVDVPDMTIGNIAMGEIAEVVAQTDSKELTPEIIQKKVEARLKATEYGLSFTYVKIINYAIVKTYRLMGDKHYIEGSLNMFEPSQSPR